MDGGVAVIVGSIVGGVTGLAGAILGDALGDRRLARREGRAILRANLYAIQEAVNEVFGSHRKLLLQRFEGIGDPTQVLIDAEEAAKRVGQLSVRVGDDILAERIKAVMGEISASRKQSDSSEANRLLISALKLQKPMSFRIGQLLHSNAKVDYGV